MPPEIPLTQPIVSGKLRAALPSDMPMIIEWLKIFYAETLHTDIPELSLSKNTENPESSVKLFVWVEEDSPPIAMGMLASEGEFCRINLIYVTPAFRGKGYGKALVSALSALVRENSQTPVLHTSHENHVALKLYASIGFREFTLNQ